MSAPDLPTTPTDRHLSMHADTHLPAEGQRPDRGDATSSSTGHVADARDVAADRERPSRVWHDADVPQNRGHEVVPRSRSELAARAVNILIASVALLVLSPLLVVLGVLIKLTSPGPIIYRQTRIGLNRRTRPATPALYDRRLGNLGGQAFTIYKFRSMCVDAERGTGAVWAQKRDARVTPLGAFMRKTRLDEIPQLLNVLKGDMSIVGPRPERPSIFRELSQSIDSYELRQRALPGITGWAQVNQNYDTCLADVENKVRYDLEYLQRQSVAEDLKIMIRTVPTMLLRKSGW